MEESKKIAYFSMEIGLDPAMPTYSGGLGVLAGDTILSGADLKIPMVAVTLLHRKGYFYQRLAQDGWQTEEAVEWVPQDFARELKPRVSVTIQNRPVAIRAWEYAVKGIGGYTIPVYLLDTDLDENAPQDRMLTHHLYGQDLKYRLSQEIVLGIGGIRMLRALGHAQLDRFHMNEGHASMLTIELLDERIRSRQGGAIVPDDIAQIRRQCVFTTHTPVAAGHDKFPMTLVREVFGAHEAFGFEDIFCCDNQLNLTYLALNLSHYVNGVAKQHGEVSRQMFAGYTIDAITNGVNASRWVCPSFQELFDRHIPGWREDNFSLRYALSIPCDEMTQAHQLAKRELIQHVNQQSNLGMDTEVLTLGFARRATSYKRADLIFTDLERLRAISKNAGRLQLVFSGKAHPNDTEGKELIKRIFGAARELRSAIKIAYLPNYDITLGLLLTAGVDVWLNTPQPPMEASGTSGMKAAMNGVPSLSILDGWWIEGCIEGITGWAIGENHRLEHPRSQAADAEQLYRKLEQVVRLYYTEPGRFCAVRTHTIALNGSFFNTQRMMQQYVLKAYFG
ncbi:MAG: alpha-glucan family phosphorylase [Planctomycetales bacterium]|nr:alpha-glucan family phosphorylase [Planctomycetales bacterium]